MEGVSDGFFSSVIDAAPDAMLIVDGNGTVTFANRQAEGMFGMPRSSLVGSPVDGLLPEELRARHRVHRQEYAANPSARPMGVDLLLQARRADGRQFPVEVSLSPLSDDASGPSVVVAVRDVSARVAVEDQMRRVLRTLDAMEDAVLIMDADTLRFTYVNEGAARQLGYAREELVGMTPMRINPLTTEPGLRARLDELAHEQRPVHLLSTHRRRDGTELPIEVTLQNAPGGQDGARLVIFVARDITERLRAEGELERSRSALREADRAMAVADDRDRIARDLHDIVIQRLFASGLALQALLQRADPSMAARIEGVVEDLDQTISDIRSTIFALQAVHAGDAGVRLSILEVTRDAARALGFEPRVQFDGPIETVDPDVAEHAVAVAREALANVARHAGASAAILHLAVSEGVVTLAVTDDGRGIPHDRPTGNGLGNMRWRADSLGGTFTIESVDRPGTTVVWCVPAHDAAAEPSSRGAQAP